MKVQNPGIVDDKDVLVAVIDNSSEGKEDEPKYLGFPNLHGQLIRDEPLVDLIIDGKNVGDAIGKTTDMILHDYKIGHSHQDMMNIRVGFYALMGLGADAVIRIQANCWMHKEGWLHKMRNLLDGEEKFVGLGRNGLDGVNTLVFGIRSSLVPQISTDVRLPLEQHVYAELTSKNIPHLIVDSQTLEGALEIEFQRNKNDSTIEKKINQLKYFLKRYKWNEEQREVLELQLECLEETPDLWMRTFITI